MWPVLGVTWLVGTGTRRDPRSSDGDLLREGSVDAEEVRDRVGGWSVGQRRKSNWVILRYVRSKCSTVVDDFKLCGRLGPSTPLHS